MHWQPVLAEWLYLLQFFFYLLQKQIGEESLVQTVPEVFDVIAKRKSPREAAKTAMKKTTRKQIGGKANVLQRNEKPLRNQNANREVSPISFQKSKMLPNILPLEASHSSRENTERSPNLITFDSSFEQKIGPIYSPNGPTLEFEVVGDRNNFLDLQKVFLEIKCKIKQSDRIDLRCDATDATQTDTPIFANNTLHSLFSECTVTSNGVKISNANGVSHTRPLLKPNIQMARKPKIHGYVAKDTV